MPWYLHEREQFIMNERQQLQRIERHLFISDTPVLEGRDFNFGPYTTKHEAVEAVEQLIRDEDGIVRFRGETLR